MEVRIFSTVEVGDVFTDQYQPTGEHVATFFELTSAGTPRGQGGRFGDEAFARSEGLAKPIIPGTLSLGLMSRLVTTWMGSTGLVRKLDVSYRRPVQHDDELDAVCLVTEVKPEGEGGLVELDIYLENRRGERPLQGTATVLLPK